MFRFKIFPVYPIFEQLLEINLMNLKTKMIVGIFKKILVMTENY